MHTQPNLPYPAPAKPISPAAHGAIDYAFAAAHLLAPSLLGLKGPARSLCYIFGLKVLALNALSDHPLALNRAIPMPTHKKLETSLLPGLVILPAVTGAWRQPAAGAFFLGSLLVGLTNYLLTDYQANERAAQRRYDDDHPMAQAHHPASQLQGAGGTMPRQWTTARHTNSERHNPAYQ
jgi:hypothetical protein